MRSEFTASIQEAKQHIDKIIDPAHSIIHVSAVVKRAESIAKHYPQVNPEIITLAAWWHDVGRLFFRTHEALGAQLAYESLYRLGVEVDTCNTVFDAIAYHKWSMKPRTLEGRIIKDADKLDYISIDRWQACIDSKSYESITKIADLLPDLRNRILQLEVSKKMYDEMLVEFKQFISNITDEQLMTTKQKILNMT